MWATLTHTPNRDTDAANTASVNERLIGRRLRAREKERERERDRLQTFLLGMDLTSLGTRTWFMHTSSGLLLLVVGSNTFCFALSLAAAEFGIICSKLKDDAETGFVSLLLVISRK